MPVRKVQLPQIGEVILTKRRGAKNLRLSITAKGEVRVSIPSWTPYSAGISFARSRQEWIIEHRSKHIAQPISDGAKVGKFHSVRYTLSNGTKLPRVRIKNNIIEVTANTVISEPQVQKKLLEACQKALKVEAVETLPTRLNRLADIHGFKYKDVLIRKLVSRWGSCSKDGIITLSYFLMQLPWELIDYVLLHELTHTKHLNHSANFWRELDQVLPNAKLLKKQIREYKPQVQPF